MRDIMDETKNMESDIKKLRDEVSELRKVVNLILGLMMEEEDEFADEERVNENTSSLYN